MANRELSFEDFKTMAKNKSLSKYEMIGFPDNYRKDFEKNILADILTKLPFDKTQNKIILDIGCGCSDLVNYIIDLSKANDHELLLVDSNEMLDNISVEESNRIKKFPGYFPELPELFENYASKVDYIILYSVLHYIFNQSNMFGTLHKAVELLKPGGMMLIGDIPNINKRKRFLESEDGKKFLSNNFSAMGATNHDSESEKIDDTIVFAIMSRFRNFNCETYLLQQDSSLPMANRREDILIIKR